MSKVSVIIPVYNTEKYLNECIDSVINQTLKDIDIILVDDGSTDNSGAICDEYAKKDTRIKIIHQENSYVGIARNNGMAIAESEYLICLDSDDWFETDMIETMYNKAIQTNADIVICKERGYDCKKDKYIKMPFCLDKSLIPKNKEVFNADDIPKYIFQFSVLWPWDKLYKRDFLLKNNIKFPDNRIVEASEDLVFVSETLALANKITFVDKIFITHRYSDSSLEANRKPNVSFEALRMLFQKLKNRNLFDKYKQSFINLVLAIFMWDIRISRKKRRRELKKNIKKGLKYFEIEKYSEDYFYQYEHYKQYLALFNKKEIIYRKIFILFYLNNIEQE